MKKILFCAIAVLLVLGGAVFFYFHSVSSLKDELSAKEEQEELMNQRIKEIQEELDASEAEKDSLAKRIDELLTEEVAVLDSEAIAEEINNIGELATVEYRYTNVGTVDSSKKFTFLDANVPFSGKTAIVTMDGILKVGINFTSVKIECIETTKTITVRLPKAEILSNELDEDSMQVYTEQSSLFNKLTLQDGSELRKQIKSKAEENALENDLLVQATDNAKSFVRCIIESVPAVKDGYTIVFK